MSEWEVVSSIDAKQSEWETVSQVDNEWETVSTVPNHDWGTTDVRDVAAHKPRKVGTAEALQRGASSAVPSAIVAANYPGLGAMALWDKGASLLGGKETTAATDWYAKKFMEPSTKQIEANDLQSNEQYEGLPAEVAYKLPKAAGQLVGDMALGIPAANASSKLLQQSLKGLVPTFAQRIGQEAVPSIMAGSTMASKSAEETYLRLREKGVSEERAVLAATADAAIVLAQVAAPMATKGNIVKRALQGGSSNVVGEHAETNVVNMIVSELSDAQIKRTTGDDIVSFILGAGMAGALGQKADTPTTAKSRAEQEAIDFVNSQRKPSEPGISKATSDPAAGIDASEMKLPYMTAHKADIVNRYNEMLQARGEETIAGDRQLDNVIKNEREYNKPYWPDQELQDAIGSANKRANAIDNLPAAVEVKTPFTDIQSPYMSKEQLIKAQDQVDKTGEPAHSYMEIPEEMGTPPFWPDEALEKAKVSANRTATRRTGGPVDISRDGGGMVADEATRPSLNDPNRIRDLQTNAKFANEIGKVSTLKDALNVVYKYLKDPDQLKVLQVLRQYADGDTGFRLYNPEEVNAAPEGAGVRALGENALGLHLVDDQGNTRVAVRGVNYFLDLKQNHGITSEVIMHEAGHNVTDRAFYIAADDKLRTLPKYRAHIQYALDMHNLRQAVEEQMTLEQRNEWRNALQNTAEFNAYGWTSPEFREFLKSIELPQQATTAWGKFKEFVTSFFGSKPKTKNAKDSIDAFLDRLDEIQEVSKQDYGDAITRLNATAVREMRPLGKPSPDDIDTAAKAIKAANGKDISEWKALVPMTVNQKALYLQIPVVKFVYDHFRTINAEADVRFNQYKTYLKDVEDLIENKRNDALEMFKVLAKIQDPELKERRQVSEVANTREDFLREHGMPEHLVEPAIKVLNVLDAVGTFDQKTAEKAFGHNWRMEPMYFPREHTGAFTVAVMDADGKMQYMRGFDNGPMANQAKASLERQLEGRGYTIELTRNSANSLLDTLAAFDIYNYEMPEFLKGITDNMIKEIEVAKRKFEMERAGHNIAGYTGEVVYGDKAKTIGEKLSDDKLLSLLQRRLEQSFQLETKARVIKEIKEPLLDDPTALANMPNTATLIRLMINRELGISINALEPIAKRADATVEMVGKQIDKIAGAMIGYKGGEVSAFKSREIARFVQAYTGVMSLFKLGLAPSVLLANTTTMLTTPVDGLRTAWHLKLNPAIASLATLKSMVSHLDKDAMQWMKQADLEGMVEARISDPLQLTTNIHMRLNFERKVNTVRDIIEKGTNYSTLLYYYNFYKMAYPNLNPYSRQFKNLVYESTRSWTGDYTNQAQMLAIDMMGDVGRLHSNFAKWKWNQWGRLMNDLQDMKSGNIGPFAVTMLYTVAMAGAFGAPIVQEWEGLRRLGQKLGWWDIRPLAKVLYDLQDKMKDEFGDSAGRITNMLIHGPLSTASDEAFKAMGMTSGPDISGNLRFSSLTDVNTLPFSFAADLYAFGNSSVKQIGGILGLGPGAQFQEIKDGLKGTPTVVQNVLEEMYKNRDQTGSVFKQGMVEQFANQDKGLERLAPEEKAMAYLGLRSKRMNENVNRVYNKEWVERYEKKQFSKYTNLLVQNVNNPKQFDSVAQDIFELKGPKGIEEAIQKMIEIRKNRDTSYFEREAMGLMNNQDPIAVSKAIERLRNFRPSK